MSKPPSSQTSMSLQKDFYFYFDDHKIFKVEDRLFRLPVGELVKECEFFQDMFGDASPRVDVEKGEEGLSESYPIEILDETASAFVLLLTWIFKHQITISWDMDDWIECLRIAHKFRVPKMTQGAMEALEVVSYGPGGKNIQPLQKLHLCCSYDLDLRWAQDDISLLCHRWDALPSLDSDEASAWPTKIRLGFMSARESIFKQKTREARCAWCEECKKWDSSTESHLGRCTNPRLMIDEGYKHAIIEHFFQVIR
ncbi:hypothetical protein DL96DRAFT_1683437 [Flagelloscypha sp. PMI_526]|nr:hypothetical protein DL96DRAFT_1683437 [Flagelloscypha sp. PMI_526]